MMDKQFRNENTDMLMRAVMSAGSIDECYDFFRDLCTESEIKIMSQRLHVARMLKDSRMFSDIVRETEAGTATINHVNSILTNGTGGYTRAIERVESEHFGGDSI